MASWPDHNDIEEIFKKGTQRHEFQYDPHAWEKMEGLLDRQKRKKFLFWFMGISSALLIGAFGLFLLIPSNDAFVNQGTQEVVEHTKRKSSGSVEELNKTSAIIEEEATESVKASSLKDLNKLSKKSSSQRNNLITINTGSETQSLKFGRSSIIPPADEKNVREIQINNELSGADVTAVTKANDKKGMLQQLNSLDFKLLPVSLGHISSQPITVFEEDEQSSGSPLFQVSVYAAAETSWTPNGEYSNLDYSIGLQVSYLLNDKLSVFVGGDYRYDTYIAEGMDYNAEDGFWGNAGMPEYINASCDMVEITAGVNYAFNGLHNSGFIANAGLVSNIMVNEFYNYHFEDRSHNFHSSWVNSNSTIIGNLDLGFGYRQMIGNRYFIDVTPYAKLPINGIGHGNLMLSSFGIRMQVGLGLGN